MVGATLAVIKKMEISFKVNKKTSKSTQIFKKYTKKLSEIIYQKILKCWQFSVSTWKHQKSDTTMQYHPLGSIYSAMFLSGLVQYMLNFDAVFFTPFFWIRLNLQNKFVIFAFINLKEF